MAKFQEEMGASMASLRESFGDEIALQQEAQRRQWLGMSQALTAMAGGGMPGGDIGMQMPPPMGSARPKSFGGVSSRLQGSMLGGPGSHLSTGEVSGPDLEEVVKTVLESASPYATNGGYVTSVGLQAEAAKEEAAEALKAKAAAEAELVEQKARPSF